MKTCQRGQFLVEGEQYKHPMKPDTPASIAAYYNRKSFYLVSLHPAQAQGIPASFVRKIAKAFETIAPLYQYLAQLLHSDQP